MKILFPALILVLLSTACQAVPQAPILPPADLAHPGQPEMDWDFEHPPKGWCEQASSPAGAFYCEEGEFHLVNTGTNGVAPFSVGSFLDFTFQAEMASLDGSGSYGLAFRWDDNTASSYIFRLRPSGQFQLMKWSSGQPETVLIPWTPSDAIHQGQALNLVEVTAIGNEITLSVNNQQLTTLHDASFLQGSVGPIVTEQGHAVVDTIKIWRIRIGDEPTHLTLM